MCEIIIKIVRYITETLDETSMLITKSL